MNRVKKIIICTSVAVLLLLGAIEIYVQSDTFALQIRPYVIGPLKSVLGEGADIGWIKANFIPLYLEIRDISLPDLQGRQIISIHKVRVYLNPLPLLLKKIRLSSISVMDPRVSVVRGPDGVLNVMPLVERIKSNVASTESGGSDGFKLLLRTVSIRNGQIVFEDSGTSARVSITDINLTTRINLAQDRARTVIRDARLQASVPAYPVLAGELKAALELVHGKLHIDSAEFSMSDAQLVLSGDAGPLPDPALDLKLSVKSGPKTIRRFTDILKPGRKKEAPRLTLAASIRGTVSDPAVEGTARMSGLSFRGILLHEAALTFSYRNKTAVINGAQWKLSENQKSLVIDHIDAALGYDKGTLDIRNFDIVAGDLALHLRGSAVPSTGLNANLSIESSAKGQTLTALTSIPVEGTITIDGRLTGALTAPKFDGALTAGPVTVRGIPFHDVSGNVSYRNQSIELTSVNIREQSSRYILDGSVDFKKIEEPVFDARLQIVRSDVVNIVALFYKKIPIHLTAEGELTFEGTVKNYSGTGSLQFEAGSAYGETFTRGTIEAELSTGKIAFPQIMLFKEKGFAKASGWIGFDGTYSADLESNDIDLAAMKRLSGLPVSGAFNLKLNSSGSFSRPYAKASLDVDNLHFQTVPAGRMNADAEINNGLLTVAAELSEKQRASLSLRWNLHKPYVWTAEARIKSDDIDPLQIAGYKELSGSVKVVAEGGITAHGKGLDMSSLGGEAVFQKLSVAIGEYHIDNESDARVSIDGGKITASSLNFTGPATKFSITGWARPVSEIDMTLKGKADLSLLKLFFHDMEHAAGTANMQLTVKDEWKNPDVIGELRIQNGEIKMKDIPQRFSALNGKIVFTQGRIVADSLSMEMGGGSLKASGWAQLAGVSLKEFSVQTTVDNVTVRYPAGLVSTLSGELNYDGNASEQSLSGDIAIKRARYDKPIEWKTMLVDVGKGLYQKKKTDVGWIGETQINVRFHGANSIQFQNNLASMPLDVDIFLRGTVNHPQLLGRLEARSGVVYFRKNDFKILHASADFVDPGRMNPVLDIQAETRVREYQIRLVVTGTADRATVTIVSEPALSDADIVGLLALGKKSSELKGKETGVGMGEAASFATGQFQDIFERRARSLTGLDRFQVDPYVSKSDTSVPRVTVGKEVVPNKLIVNYSSNVGASVPEQIFRIEYLLDRHFSLVGERNDLGNTGADIKYRFEFK